MVNELKHSHLQKFSIAFVLSIVILSDCVAQKQGNIWYFGDSAGLDFNTYPPTPLLDGQTDFHLPLGWNEATSSIADSSGNLLFYSNGERVWNKDHQIMPNGDNLLGHSSSAAAALIVPQPNSDYYYYLFTTDAGEHGFLNGMNYSLIDICADNNNGDIVSGEKNIHLVDTTSEKLEAVRHSNGVDYWIITHKVYSNEFWSLLLTENGIVDTVISTTPSLDMIGWGGHMVVSQNGQQIAYAITSIQTLLGRGLLLDFDNSTGIVSNERMLVAGGRLYGASFSPDNSKLYFSTAGIGELFQFDLAAGSLADIIASKHFLFTGFPDQWRHHQLGPDGNIYISRAGQPYLARIENPNLQGIGAVYVDNAVHLGGQFTSHGLPNLITNYDYSNNLSYCPTTGISDFSNTKVNRIYPNPITDHSVITLDPEFHESVKMELLDIQGRIVKELFDIEDGGLLHRSQLPKGILIYRIYSNSKVVSMGKLIVE